MIPSSLFHLQTTGGRDFLAISSAGGDLDSSEVAPGHQIGEHLPG